MATFRALIARKKNGVIVHVRISRESRGMAMNKSRAQHNAPTRQTDITMQVNGLEMR